MFQDDAPEDIEFNDKAFDVFKHNDSREELSARRLATEENEDDDGKIDENPYGASKKKKNLFGARRGTRESAKGFAAKKIKEADLDKNWFQ